MKTNKTFAYGFLTVILALAFFACDNDNGSETHTHEYSATWSSNETQHWRECSCGDKTDVADHDWGKWQETTQPTITSEGEETRTCNTCEKTETQSIAKLQEYIYSYPQVNLPSPTLNFQPIDLPAGITYTLNDDNGPVTHTNGVVNGSTYGPFAPLTTFTQTFYKDGNQIGQQIVKASTNSGANFGILRDANSTQVYQIPDVKLTY